MAERKSGPVKPPVIDLKARDASQPAASDKPEAKPAAPKAAAAKPRPEPVTAPTPEPVRPIPATPTPPPPPLRQARLAMPWSAISIAAIGGALLGTALTYALVNLVPMPSNAPVIADPAEQLAALDSRLLALEGRLPALEESGMDAQVNLTAANTRIDDGLAGVESSIASLQSGLAEVRAAIPAAASVDLSGIETQLDTLDARVTAIAAGASSADAAALADDLNTIGASVAALTARLDAADGQLAEIGRIGAELDTAKAAIAAQNQTLGGADIGPAVKLPLVVSGLEIAFAAGRPFAAELASLRALLPDLAVPAAVTGVSETGLKRPDALVSDFRLAVPTILAGRMAESTGDWGKDAIEWAKALLALRPTGEMPGDSPEAVVSRLEAAMERRDFTAAAALLDQLPAPMQTAAGILATDIRAHAAADAFVAGLRAQALAPVAEAAP